MELTCLSVDVEMDSSIPMQAQLTPKRGLDVIVFPAIAGDLSLGLAVCKAVGESGYDHPFGWVRLGPNNSLIKDMCIVGHKVTGHIVTVSSPF